MFGQAQFGTNNNKNNKNKYCIREAAINRMRGGVYGFGGLRPPDADPPQIRRHPTVPPPFFPTAVSTPPKSQDFHPYPPQIAKVRMCFATFGIS